MSGLLEFKSSSFFSNVDNYRRTDQGQAWVFSPMQNGSHGEAASCEPLLPTPSRITILDRLPGKFLAMAETAALQPVLEPANELKRPGAGKNKLRNQPGEPFPDGQIDVGET